jgi:hypothetical protein
MEKMICIKHFFQQNLSVSNKLNCVKNKCSFRSLCFLIKKTYYNNIMGKKRTKIKTSP